MSDEDLNNNIKESDFAPVLLVAFNRPKHFYQTLIALCNNNCAYRTILYISIDGPRNENDKECQKLILRHIKVAENCFAKVIILKNEYNKGLAQNITESISYVFNQYEKIIVVEDDLITSSAFLSFMNDALDFYKNKNDVWHINGYNEVSKKNKKDEIFLWRFMNCWGWATWKDRWCNFEINPDLIKQSFNDDMIYEFNLDGVCNFWDQVIQNLNGEKKTWAIFWYATIFLNKGICVSPWFSYVRNIGFDGSGINCEKSISKAKFQEINNYGKFIGVLNLVEDKNAFKIMQKKYSKSFLKVVIIKFLIKTFGIKRYEIFKKFLKKLL